MIKVSTSGIVVSLKTDLRFPIPGQQGHGHRIIQESPMTSNGLEHTALIRAKTEIMRNASLFYNESRKLCREGGDVRWQA